MTNIKPEKISAKEWENRISSIPDEYSSKCTFLKSLIPGGVKYLFSPVEYSCRGDSLLNRLKFDSGFASLRLWAFLFSEKDRLFLAKEKGWKVFAAMKDLGQVPIISYAFPNTITFYADELWWAPCFAENLNLLEVAEKLGAGNELCYIRAAAGAYKTLDYFPKPDLSFAGVGSCCDDFSAVMQLIEHQGNPIHWWEIPARFDCLPQLINTKFIETFSGKSPYQEPALKFLIKQFEGIINKLEEVTGTKITDDDLRKSIKSFNILRGKVQKLRNLVYGSQNPPLPGLEMFLIEFIALHYCSDPDESINVLDDLIEMVQRRIENNESPLTASKPLRVFWVTPPTDAALVTLLEDLGGCIAGTEYLISHVFFQLDENKHPLEAIAENYLDDPMIGTSLFRAKRIVSEATKYKAEGILITGIFGASHCAYEEKVISDLVRKELDIPVLSFDVPFTPGNISEQVITRMQGFMELLNIRRDI